MHLPQIHLQVNHDHAMQLATIIQLHTPAHYRYSIIIIHTHTHASYTSDFKRDVVFPQNLAVVIFYFKVLFGVVTIRRQLDLEGSVYRDRHAYEYTYSIVSLFVCRYYACAHTYIAVDPLPCGEILGAAFIGVSWQKHVATFLG